MLEELLMAENLKSIMLIYKVNKFYHDTTSISHYMQYLYSAWLDKNRLDIIIADIERYLHKLDSRTDLTKKDLKAYRKYTSLIGQLVTYKMTPKGNKENE